MTKLAMTATLLAVGCLSFAQTRVWENAAKQPTNSYGPAGATTAAFGQPDATQWVRWPERGPGVNLGSPQVLTEMSFYYLCNNASSLTGNENVTVQIYANNGGAITGSRGSALSQPGATPLFTSAPIRVLPGDQSVRLPLPNVAVPAQFTWTLKFQGGLFDTGPFDPTLNTNIPGGRFWCSVDASQLQGNFGGVMFRRVFTAAGPSNWGAQDNPGTAGGFPGVFAFGGSFWTGNTSLITTPYDNGTNIVGQGGFIGLSGPVVDPGTSGSKAGNLVTMSGPNRTISKIDFGYYANTFSSTGTPTFTLKLVKQIENDAWSLTGGDPDLNSVIWNSGPQPIPLGQGGAGSGALQNVTFNLPNVVVPDTFYWIFEVNGIGGFGDDVVGPGILWSPKPGDTPNFIAMFDNPSLPGTWGQFVFPPAGATGTFIYDTVAQLGPIKFTTATTSTETLAPTAEQILLGTNNSGGNLASWAADDNNARTVCKLFVPNSTSPFIRADLSYTTTKTSPTAISFDVKVSTHTPGPQGLTLLMKNQTTSAYVATSVSNANIVNGTTYNGVPTGTLSDYRNGSGLMVGRIEVKQTGPSTSLFPCASFEFAQMKVTG